MPSSKAVVNTPVNPEVRDREINEKLQYYGIYSAFANGKVPSNKQIDVALNSLLATKSLANPSSELSTETRQIIEDLRHVIISARNLVLVKNDGNMIQEFIWDATNFKGPGDIQAPDTSGEKAAAKQNAQQTAAGLRTLGTLLITNGQFRKLLQDATILIRDMASDSAQKAAGALKPSEEDLAQIDKPADENVWHESPNLSKEALKSRFKKEKSEKPQGNVDTVNGSHSINGANGVNGVNGVDGVATSQQAGTSGTADTAEVKDQATTTAKQRSKEAAERTKKFLSEKMPRERREQTIWRIKKMIVEIQGHADYQEAIETLLSIAEGYARRSKSLSKQGAGTLKGARDQSDTRKLESNLKTVIERFANSTSTDDLFDAIKKFYKNAENDPRLREWFRNVDTFIRKCLKEQGFVLRDESTAEWNRLYDEGRFLLTKRYKKDTDEVVEEGKFLANQFDEDPLNKEFGQSLKKFFDHLGHDASGNIVFQKNLLKDFVNTVLPGTLANLSYIPLPRIEVSDPMIDVVIENLAVQCDNLMPNIMEFSSDNYWRWGRKKIGNHNDNKAMISATGIQTDWRDVSYYIKKKKGFPHVSDTGVMDIFLGGDGFSFKIMGSSAQSKDKQHFFKADKVVVNIKNLDIRLKKSKHKVLFTLFKPLLLSVVRPAIQKVLELQIRQYFSKADKFAYQVHQEAQRTIELSRNDPDEKSNAYTHYSNALKSQMKARKQETEAKKKQKPPRDTKVNVCISQYDSIFKDIVLPSGISAKATEYRDLAARGERWESPVFGIGSAAPSTGLPRLDAVKRKYRNRGMGGMQRQTLPVAQSAGPSASMAEPTHVMPSKMTGLADGLMTIPGTNAPV
ncbi:hypothetical protein H112_02619 [Trichophyton rubrum D6]|uniref:Uncharacterized protein n=2 Tax=Trichophyton rubrum TaxID=5551 RepID=F2SV84_TRIRC|nr:uncharacterized protein TERG_06376 [Trichophyton rubrum CBS 118892]EZF24988.1 hypothetical protein H100_02626 [Trichophyton rubrum MR850]EZF43986.1 hypothetical protein H102_02616 [Trichophyton rubrum CBS 100081]EZF54649.1 hypothetical protein H103_02630 [Trichophyton rubrum CBS 288.86]EZF65226.1 hypothetical protein H104_02608 [Trichophyton rubrum CBS 289.86]EZF86547.1 hypothetical protein H110_02625 [Trichophyton rubrum MR1448]EZF97313.1 hypothetical protein H113_02635 [Trichophyton rubr